MIQASLYSFPAHTIVYFWTIFVLCRFHWKVKSSLEATGIALSEVSLTSAVSRNINSWIVILPLKMLISSLIHLKAYHSFCKTLIFSCNTLVGTDQNCVALEENCLNNRCLSVTVHCRIMSIMYLHSSPYHLNPRAGFCMEAIILHKKNLIGMNLLPESVTKY